MGWGWFDGLLCVVCGVMACGDSKWLEIGAEVSPRCRSPAKKRCLLWGTLAPKEIRVGVACNASA